MGGEMVLLRAVDDAREGWNWMPFGEFLERVNLALWKDSQVLVGMVLPQGRPGQHSREAGEHRATRASHATH